MYAFDAVLSALLDLARRRPHRSAEHFTPRGLIIDFEVDPADPRRVVASNGGRAVSLAGRGRLVAADRPARGHPPRMAGAGRALPRAEGRDRRALRRRRRDVAGAPAAVDGEPYKFHAIAARRAVPRAQRRDDPAHDRRREDVEGGVPAMRRRVAAGTSAAAAALLSARPAPGALARAAGGRGRVVHLRRRDVAEHARRCAPAARGSSSATRRSTAAWIPATARPATSAPTPTPGSCRRSARAPACSRCASTSASARTPRPSRSASRRRCSAAPAPTA